MKHKRFKVKITDTLTDEKLSSFNCDTAIVVFHNGHGIENQLIGTTDVSDSTNIMMLLSMSEAILAFATRMKISTRDCQEFVAAQVMAEDIVDTDSAEKLMYLLKAIEALEV